MQVQKSTPEKHQFVLDITRAVESTMEQSEAVLVVNAIRVVSLYEGKGFKYRKGDLSIEADFYNEFFTQPGAMITEEVQQWLSRSGLFRRVMTESGYMLPTHALEGTVEAIYGDYSFTVPRAVLELEFVLVKDPAGRPEVAFEKTYRREIPAPGGKPPDLVKAWNSTLSEILTAFENDLRTKVFFR